METHEMVDKNIRYRFTGTNQVELKEADRQTCQLIMHEWTMKFLHEANLEMLKQLNEYISKSFEVRRRRCDK